VPLQETKLMNINQFKASTFVLPRHLQNYVSLDSINACCCLITAWNANKFKLISSFSKTFTITTQFESETSSTLFWISIVYGTNDDVERQEFFQEIRDIANQVQAPCGS
jgi:hypothetical protein